MSISDELLMRFADGELDPAARAEVERALAAEVALAARISELRSQRERLRRAYAPALEESVPERLLAVLRPQAAKRATAVVNLAARRRPVAERVRNWSWPEWSAIAAGVLLGVLVMQLSAHRSDDVPFAAGPNGLVAGPALAEALSTQLASSQAADAPIQVGLSYGSHAGELCRTFAARSSRPWSGLACFSGGKWRLEMAIERDGPNGQPSPGAMRTAASEIPPEILRAATEQMSGEPMDADAERAARDHGWHR